ncbi:glycosyltransferase [Chaetomidium leptoderma]|uniref:Glycosyltransferase n=1 Tax=Chaetomidium leptoderma TaxID=669021 RepID=A0AAN6ZTC1_9PEZI|nr:glycosyltransferase [Chaetomidium leptoderma]
MARLEFLHHVTRHRHRVHGLVGVALVLLAGAVWVYGGFATGMQDFTIVVPRPPQVFPPKNAPTDPHSNGSDDWRHSTQSPAAVKPGIPPKIWQIMLPKKPLGAKFIADAKILADTPSWLAMNTDYTYTLVGQEGGEEFVRSHFGSDPRILEAYTKMPNVGMKSDLLRYLLLEAEGGVYSDTDTVALKPIDDWVPAAIRDQVAVVVGLEFDRRDGSHWADILHDVQFCQWTIAAAPGHAVFRKMAARIVASLDDLSAQHGVPFEQLKPSSVEVMNSTGPAAWTDVVFQQLQEFDPSLTELKDLWYMTKPRLYGDILVLTIDGFGMGQPHSKSTSDGTIPEAALVKHQFKGSWRGDS